MRSLVEEEVVIVDCQAGGATPAHGDLLELGWAVGSGARDVVGARATWVRPATERPISRWVRKLTGWDADALSRSVDAQEAWRTLRDDARATGASPVPAVIHFARFERAFLDDLHARSDRAGEAFPLDVVCLHAIAERLFPDLPRRSIRALAGHLGHSPGLLRRAGGHVEATLFIWRALLPRLDALSITTWSELRAWLDEPSPSSRVRRQKLGFPMPAARRRALPDAPGVYRFLRPNGDVLYVGKATSLKKRVASHFGARSRPAERALEMLSQCHDVDVTPTATPLEAALLEVDEIQRLDPPYNQQLRTGGRSAWFATRDWSDAAPARSDVHVVGPLPSERALAALGTIRALLLGELATDARRAAAVGVPAAFAPEASIFEEAWRGFVAEELQGSAPVRTRILLAGDRLRAVEEAEDDPEAPDGWDAPSVRRYLVRAVVAGTALVRRAALLGLLSDAEVVFREPRSTARRVLSIEGGVIVSREERSGPPRRPPPRHERQAAIDASRYDRLRVLATELRRVATEGGAVIVRVGAHVLGSAGGLDQGAAVEISDKVSVALVNGAPSIVIVPL